MNYSLLKTEVISFPVHLASGSIDISKMLIELMWNNFNLKFQNFAENSLELGAVCSVFIADGNFLHFISKLS